LTFKNKKNIALSLKRVKENPIFESDPKMFRVTEDIKLETFPEPVFSIPELPSFEIPGLKSAYPVKKKKFL
jgi:hypothetical protein